MREQNQNNNPVTNSDAENQIPVQVRSNIEIEKQKYQQDIVASQQQNAQIPSTTVTKASALQNILDKIKQYLPENKIIRGVLIVFTSLILCFGILLIFTVSNLDTLVVKTSLSGKIIDKISGEGISDVIIFINGNDLGKTDANGNYTISGLEVGNSRVRLTKEGYQTIDQDILISRKFLDYSTYKDFELLPVERAAFEGRFIVSDPNYNFLDDRIIIGEQEFKIELNGQFKLHNIQVGKHIFELKSLNYKDLSTEIEITPGVNTLGELELTPAGDIEGSLLSYVNETVVEHAKFNIENVSDSQIELKGDRFKIRDLEVGREYAIQVVADGYNTRNYKITIKQGLNQLFDFRLVEVGRAVYLSEDPNTRRDQFFTSDFDGENLERVSNFESRVGIYSYRYIPEEDKIYYQSDKERLRGFSSSVRVVYSIDLKTKEDKRVTLDFDNLGLVSANYFAKKIISTYRTRNTGNIYSNYIEIMDLNGNNKVQVPTSELSTQETVLSKDGNYLFVLQGDSQPFTLSRVNLSNLVSESIIQEDDIRIFDVNEDGNLVIYERRNQTTGFKDLFIYNMTTLEERTLDSNHTGLQYQFVRGDDNRIVYFANRGGSYDIYIHTIDSNKSDKLTNLRTASQITQIFQNDRYLYYVIPNSIYILDIDQSKNFRIVRKF